MGMSWPDVEHAVTEIADSWRADRAERQTRRHLDPADFDRLRAAGVLSAPVPEAMGGLWRSVAESTRPICRLLRTLAAADPSVALVSSMHPSVIGFWLAAPGASNPSWVEQRDAILATALEGAQWGTITSEPGSGGDIGRTKARATPNGVESGSPLPGGTYLISGDKHFGSGSGVTSFMITTAVPDGEAEPTIFVLDTRDRATPRCGRSRVWRSSPKPRCRGSHASSAEGRSRGGRRSPPGSRTFAPSGSSGPRGAWHTTACFSRRSPRAATARP